MESGQSVESAIRADGSSYNLAVNPAAVELVEHAASCGVHGDVVQNSVSSRTQSNDVRETSIAIKVARVSADCRLPLSHRLPSWMLSAQWDDDGRGFAMRTCGV